MASYSCRPTPLTFAENLTRHFGGARIYIKREDLNHTGAHKANNVMGQGLLVKRMGKTPRDRRDRRRAARRRDRDHGRQVRLRVHDLHGRGRRRAPAAERVLDGAAWAPTVVPVKDGARTLKDAINEAFRDWVANMDTTHYVLGTACGPHPFPDDGHLLSKSIVGQRARAHRCSKRTAAAGSRVRVRRRRLERAGHLLRVLRRCEGRARRRRSGRARPRQRPARRAPVLAGCQRGRGARLQDLLPAEPRRPDERDALRGRRARLHRRLAHPRAPARTPGACASRRRPTRGGRRALRSPCARKASSRRSSRRTRSRRRSKRRARSTRTTLVRDQSIRPRRQGHLHHRRRVRRSGVGRVHHEEGGGLPCIEAEIESPHVSSETSC